MCGPSTSPTPSVWWGLGSCEVPRASGLREDPVCFSEPWEEVDLHSLSPQSRFCGVHFPCASGHLEAAPWGDGRACSPRGETLVIGFFFCSVHSHSLWLRQMHLCLGTCFHDCSMQKEAR